MGEPIPVGEPTVMMLMKASSISIREQCRAGTPAGTILTTPEALKAEQDLKKQQDHLLALEKWQQMA